MLLITAGTIQGISKGSLASVALETITNFICSKQKATPIIEDNEISSKLKYELKIGLKKIKPLVLPEQYSILENKLTHINNCPNSQKLEAPFEILGIILTEEEKYCLKCRNKILHGVLPDNKKLKMLTEEERVFCVSNKLIMLSSMLLLKKIGYEYNVIDWGYTEIAKKRTILKGQRVRSGNIFRKICNTEN